MPKGKVGLDLVRCPIYLTHKQLRWITLRADGLRSKSEVVRELLNRVMEIMPMEDEPPST
jgi:hypothetical protein